MNRSSPPRPIPDDGASAPDPLPGRRALRYGVATCRYAAEELREDRATQMAAALTYRTIFSLIPILVLSLVVFNAFGGFEAVGGDLQQRAYGYLGLNLVASAPAPELIDGQPVYTVQTPEQFQKTQTALDVKKQVDTVITGLADRVQNVSFTSISVVGLALLIWAALRLVISTEDCFNHVYHAPKGRRWHLRITIYWAVLTLGPVLLALSVYITTRLLNAATSVAVVGWVAGLLAPLASLAVTWLLLILLYLLLPNARVRFRPAIAGAFVGALLWELSKLGFGYYVAKAVGYSALYGSLGLVPLFLMWMYLTWLAILFGLEISYVLQTVGTSRHLIGRLPQEPHAAEAAVVDPAWAVPVAAAVGRAFDTGDPIDADSLIEELALPGRAVRGFVGALTRAGVLRALGEEDQGDGPAPLTLGRPAERVALVDVLRAGYAATHTINRDTPSPTLGRLRAAAEAAAGDRTLRDLLDEAVGADESAERKRTEF